VALLSLHSAKVSAPGLADEGAGEKRLLEGWRVVEVAAALGLALAPA
jgi:hypothetical protein